MVSVDLFDVYRGDRVATGNRGLTYRLRLCATDRTLTEDELAGVRKKCIEGVEKRTGAMLRA